MPIFSHRPPLQNVCVCHEGRQCDGKILLHAPGGIKADCHRFTGQGFKLEPGETKDFTFVLGYLENDRESLADADAQRASLWEGSQ